MNTERSSTHRLAAGRDVGDLTRTQRRWIIAPWRAAHRVLGLMRGDFLVELAVLALSVSAGFAGWCVRGAG